MNGKIGMEKDIQWEWGKIYNVKTNQNKSVENEIIDY